MSVEQSSCAFQSGHHSGARVEVDAGREEPLILCGFHASPEWLPTVLESTRAPSLEVDGYVLVENPDGSQTATYHDEDTFPEPTVVTYHPEGTRVRVVADEETRWVGEETSYKARAGMVGTVAGWVPEWFHVHVKLGVGPDVWLCPDNLSKIEE